MGSPTAVAGGDERVMEVGDALGEGLGAGEAANAVLLIIMLATHKDL
jgi:hypothetical protein